MRINVRSQALVVLAAAGLVVAGCSGGTGADPATSPSEPGASAAPSVAVAATPSAIPTPSRPGFGEPIGEVTCDYGGHDDSYHIHALLRIFVAGVETDPDSDVGVDQTRCMYWVHTHDGTGGVVHVEAPENVTVTLGEFLDVWAVSYPTSAVYQAALAQLEAGGLTVDGTVPFGSWRAVQLIDGIRLEVL